MRLRNIEEIKNLKGKRVLLRTDFNVPLENGKILDDYRILRGVETIKYLIKNKAITIIAFHLGRPEGKYNKNLTTEPVAKRLIRLLDRKIVKLNQSVGPAVEKAVAKAKAGEVLILENLRFYKEEEENNKNFAKELSKLADIYVNDAFGACHRPHASISAIAEYLPSAAGLLLKKEVEILEEVLKRPKKPLVAIIGGAKISTKMPAIKNLLKKSDKILLGGALANTVLKAMGLAVGKSMVEPKMFAEVKNIKLTDNKLQIPLDVIVGGSFGSKKFNYAAAANVKENKYILDIGPDTLKLFENILSKAKMVLWNGPMGYIENPVFARGTKKLAKILAKCSAKTVVGGGETVEIIRNLKLEKKFYFISTGGGAMLEFLEGKMLPGIKPLVK